MAIWPPASRGGESGGNDRLVEPTKGAGVNQESSSAHNNSSNRRFGCLVAVAPSPSSGGEVEAVGVTEECSKLLTAASIDHLAQRHIDGLA